MIQEFGDLLDPNCPTRTVIDCIGDKWSSILLAFLHRDGAQRFNQLARLSGISVKMLTRTLRRLERDGLIERSVTPTRPPAVTYRLSPLGEELVPVVYRLREWAERNVGHIVSARDTYDRVNLG